MWNVDLGLGGWSPSDEDSAPDGRFSGGCSSYDEPEYNTDSRCYSGSYSGSYLPEYKEEPKPELACRKCGSTDVYWDKYPSGKWFLFTDGKPHVCVVDEKLYKHKIPKRNERDTVKSTLRSMSEREKVKQEYLNAPYCPNCGIKIGFAFGTGDCGCESSPDVGW